MFARPVGSMTFCLYSPDGKYVGSRTLIGSKAKQFAEAVESSQMVAVAAACPTTEVEILPFDSSGSRMTPLSVSRRCDVTVTNGTASRVIPVATLDGATGSAASVTGGGMSGSPPR